MKNRDLDKIKDIKNKELQLKNIKLLKYKGNKDLILNNPNKYTYIVINTKFKENKRYNSLKQGYYGYVIYSYQDGQWSELSKYQGILYNTSKIELSLKGSLYALQELKTLDSIVIELHNLPATKALLGKTKNPRYSNILSKIEQASKGAESIYFNYDHQASLLFSQGEKALNDFYHAMWSNDVKHTKKVKPVRKQRSGRVKVIKQPEYVYQALPLLNFVPDQGIRVYTDGAKRYGKKVSAYGYYLVRPDKEPIKKVRVDKQATTSQRAELRGLFQFLKDNHTLGNKMIAIVTDSQYLISVFTNQSWLETWCKNNLRKYDNQPVKNADLLIGIIKQLSNYKHVFFAKVKGHANDEGNNKIDQLLNEAMDSAE